MKTTKAYDDDSLDVRLAEAKRSLNTADLI